MSKTAPIKPFNGKPASSLQGTDISPAQAYKMTNYNERLDEILKQVSEAARQATAIIVTGKQIGRAHV